MGEKNNVELVSASLKMAVAQKREIRRRSFTLRSGSAICFNIVSAVIKRFWYHMQYESEG